MNFPLNEQTDPLKSSRKRRSQPMIEVAGLRLVVSVKMIEIGDV